ncbi:exported hypothetical protein [uncultured Mycobacterium sp.]|uniref:PE-PGRS family protein n=1 Tax=uncultured Mycobacterium sp. TaxID=171292 RepID=A0A1Y5P9P4_9MYCO|nr:exported hypothetical protein [uncultured Mycobacterium sp.]
MPGHRTSRFPLPYLRAGIATAAIIGTGYPLAAANAAAASSSTEQIAGECGSGLHRCTGRRGGLVSAATPATLPSITRVGNGTAERPDGGLLLGNGCGPDPTTRGTQCNAGWFGGSGGEGGAGGRGGAP